MQKEVFNRLDVLRNTMHIVLKKGGVGITSREDADIYCPVQETCPEALIEEIEFLTRMMIFDLEATRREKGFAEKIIRDLDEKFDRYEPPDTCQEGAD